MGKKLFGLFSSTELNVAASLCTGFMGPVAGGVLGGAVGALTAKYLDGKSTSEALWFGLKEGLISGLGGGLIGSAAKGKLFAEAGTNLKTTFSGDALKGVFGSNKSVEAMAGKPGAIKKIGLALRQDNAVKYMAHPFRAATVAGGGTFVLTKVSGGSGSGDDLRPGVIKTKVIEPTISIMTATPKSVVTGSV